MARLCDSFWDLRDDAFDHPERWQGMTAVEMFQRLAEYVENAEEHGGQIDWRRDIAARMIAWRAPE